jgi:glycosyltransferase involved in cell wall biosynthesis
MGDFYDLNQTNFILSKLSAIIPMKIVWARPRESSTQLSSLIVDEVVELTREQMPKAIGNATFGIALSKKSMGLSAKAVSPTKVAEFFATGRPVLVSAGIGDLDSQIEEFNAGVVLKGHESVEEIAEALNVLISDDNTSVRCRALAEKYYSLDKSVTKYLKLYEGILKQ